MKNLFTIYFLLISAFSFSQSDTIKILPVNDGPYIFYVNDTFKIKLIANDTLKEDWFDHNKYNNIREIFNLSFSYSDIKEEFNNKKESGQTYSGVDSIACISDVHGKFGAYINLLKANDIIDNELNWNFGGGHLVFLGDALDRGDKVTEILLHLYGLQEQAQKAGGKVHYLLGNHEIMLLAKDNRYINEKYKRVETITDTKYCDLYSENSLLGKWLRSLPVIITINDIMFAHAGISVELLQKRLNIMQINRIFSDSIVGKDFQTINKSEELKFLNGDNGPVWYRGYFKDSTFNESKTESILNFYNKKHIIVGHNTYKEFKLLYNNKIIGIDEGIVYDQPGAVLIYKEGCFYKGTLNGKRIKL